MAAKTKDTDKSASEGAPDIGAPKDTAAATAPDKQAAEKREKAKEKKGSGVMAFIKKADPIAMTCFVVFILAFGVVLGAYIDKMYIAEPPAPHVIVEGDEVEVEYTGSYFAFYDKDSKNYKASDAVVFDTNMQNVDENADIFKSPGYTDKTKFDPLKFRVGGTDVIEMFGDSVIGHTKGQTVRVAVPAPDGYGDQASKVFSLEQVFAKSGSMSLKAFNEAFDTNLKAGDFTPGAQKLNVESPFEGITVNLWYDSVTDDVTYTYNVTAANDEAKKVKTDDNVTYTISAYDDVAKTFTVKYIPDTEKNTMFKVLNPEHTVGYIYKEKSTSEEYQFREETSDKNAEQLGMTLYFVIKIVKINA